MGIALYVMLSGEAPFDQDKPVDRLLLDVRQANVSWAAPLWKKMNKHAVDIIKRFLDPNLDTRLSPTAARSHKWFTSSTKALLDLKPPPPQRCRKPTPEENPEDLEVLAALAFLTHVFDPTAGGSRGDGGPRGDLRLLVTPEPGAMGLVAVYTVRMWGVDGAFVLPTRQYDTPLALVAVLRTQLLRWVSGDSPLMPEKDKPPLTSALGSVLACFHPEVGNFRAFLAVRGEVAPDSSIKEKPPPGTTFSRKWPGAMSRKERAATMTSKFTYPQWRDPTPNEFDAHKPAAPSSKYIEVREVPKPWYEDLLPEWLAASFSACVAKCLATTGSADLANKCCATASNAARKTKAGMGLVARKSRTLVW